MKKVLVTCGATWQPIDSVRVISNISTGQMGHLVAEAFKKKGAQVTVIEGPVTCSLKTPGIKIIPYRFYDELAQILKAELRKKYDIVIHAAAVSDFKVAKVYKGKIGSSLTRTMSFPRKRESSKTLTLRLVATEKLINRIKKLSSESRLVGFKLEPGLTRKNLLKSIEKLFNQANCDWVVANTLKDGYKGYIVDASGKIITEADNKQTIARTLVRIV